MLVGACGDDDDGTGGGGIARSAQLQSLTADQFTQVCAEFSAYSDQFDASDDAKHGLCLAFATFALVEEPPDDGDLETACQEVVDVCQGSLTPAAIDEGVSMLMGDICDGGPPVSCTVTVGDVDTCLDQGIDLLTNVGKTATCASLAADGTLAGTNTEGAVLPATCEMIASANCE